MSSELVHRIFLIVLLLLINVVVYAQFQRREVHGIVIDTAGVPMRGVNVRISSIIDTMTVSTSENGLFHFKNILGTDFRLTFSMIGYKIVDRIYQMGPDYDDMRIIPVIMEEQKILINPVIVKRVKPIEMFDDTIQFNMEAYDFRKNALLEEALKELPGFRVARDGRVYFNGQEFVKVRVDGRDFFGGDVITATKNLLADYIDKVQVIDFYGEMAEQTGIKDTDPEKILNFTLKEDKKQIMFGQVTAGGGGDNLHRNTEGRYMGSVGLNNYNDGQEFSMVASTNNTNTSLFSFGAPSGAGDRVRSSELTSMIDPVDGINTTNAIGFSYSDDWSDNITTYGKYNFTNRHNNTTGRSLLENVIDGYTITNSELSDVKTEDYNHVFSWDIESQLGQLNYLKVSPTVAFNSSRVSSVIDRTTTNRSIQSDIRNTATTNMSSPNFDVDLLYTRGFTKPGRKLVLNMHGEYYRQNRFEIINDDFISTDLSFTPPRVDIYELLQHVDNDNNNRIGRAKASFVEPLDKNSILEFNYEYNYTSISSVREVLDVTREQFIDSLSVDYAYFFQANRVGINYQADKGNRLKYNLGFAIQPVLLRGFAQDHDISTEHRNINIVPSAGLRYRFSPESDISFDYLGNNNQPNFLQMQPVSNLNNSQNVLIGNPELRSEFINRVSAKYRNIAFGKSRFFETNLAFTQIQDKIVSTRFVIPNTTIQQTSFVNTSGYYDLRGYYMYSSELKNRNFQVNVNGSADYIHNISFVEESRNIGKHLIVSQAVNLRYNLEDVVETEVSSSYTVNRARYSQLSFTGMDANTFLVGFAGRTYLNDNLSFGADISYRVNSGYSSFVNANPTVINAYVEYSFLNNRMAMLRLQGFDLLDENTGITRDVFEGGFLDMQNNRLSRYFMLSLNIRLQRYPSKS